MLPDTSLPPQQLKQRALIQRLAFDFMALPVIRAQHRRLDALIDSFDRKHPACNSQQHNNSST